MHSQNRRWSPTLPSFGGRLAPRVVIPSEVLAGSYHDKLSWYYRERRSCASIFVRRVCVSWLRRVDRIDLIPTQPRLHDLDGHLLFKYLLEGFGRTRMSNHFKNSLHSLCMGGKIAAIQRWYQTVDGLLLPLLLTHPDPDRVYDQVDAIIKFGFENCANNYSHFCSRMKSLRRLLRKDYAEDRMDFPSSRAFWDLGTYYKTFRRVFDLYRSDGRVRVEVLLCWSQTRAMGLADPRMMRKSLDKAERTLSLQRVVYGRNPNLIWDEYPGFIPCETVVPQDHLDHVTKRVARRVRGENAHLSAGPHACLEFSQERGGQTQGFRVLARKKLLFREYNFIDLSFREVEPRVCRTSADVLSWAIQSVHVSKAYVQSVRMVAVAEPSKARTITVGSLPYQLIMGAMAKLFQPSIVSDISRTGLEKTRNLFEFLYTDLDPGDQTWGLIRPKPFKREVLYGLSSDLEEATDYGDIAVARQLLQSLIWNCRRIPNFPLGFAVLAKTLFIGKRFIFRMVESRGYRFFVKRSGWLMGDRLTKVVLTLSHEVAVRVAGLTAARICGDDVTALSTSKEKLLEYRSVVERLGFKISDEDFFVSSKLIFYCEEAALVPQKAGDLPVVCFRRGKPSCYIDYPRIRLLIPAKMDTHPSSFTDLGRLSLLGKECRWVFQNGTPSAREMFTRASLVQHLLVPAPSDTLCPWLPIELGGDGSFPPSGAALYDFVRAHSRNIPETAFRMSCLLTGSYGFKYVRSDVLDNVIHKYHMMVPKVDTLRTLLPEDAIINADDKLLGSVKCRGLEPPERVYLRLYRSYYWYNVLHALPEPDLKFDFSRAHMHGQAGVELTLELCTEFYHTWRDSGFTFQDKPAYLVRISRIKCADHLSLGWTFVAQDGSGPESQDTLSLVRDEHIEAFLDHLQTGSPLPAPVFDRLHRYVESDSYLLYEVSRWQHAPLVVLLVSGDKRLARHLARVLRGKPLKCAAPFFGVVMVDPGDYQMGFMGHHERQADRFCRDPDEEYRVLVDFGAVAYWALVCQDPEYLDLDDPEPPVAWDIVTIRGEISPGVYHSRIIAGRSDEVWSLTTQPKSTWATRLGRPAPISSSVLLDLPPSVLANLAQGTYT